MEFDPWDFCTAIDVIISHMNSKQPKVTVNYSLYHYKNILSLKNLFNYKRAPLLSKITVDPSMKYL